MRLPSLNYLYTNASESFIRFPLTLISAIAGCIIAIYLIELNKDFNEIIQFVNALLCCALGIPLFFCIKIFTEKMGYDRKVGYMFNAGGILALIVMYFSLPSEGSTTITATPYIRYGLYNLAVHLLVAFIPYISKMEINGFWQYNKVLFLRLWLAVLYSGFLYAGLSLALLAIDYLFEVKIHEELYAEMWIVIIGVFNTWFFVNGIPRDLKALDASKDYPKALKIFTQYVLLSLVGVYLVILYGYAGKILLAWDWPKGLVSYLILCVSILGILTTLLMHPFGNLAGNRWIKRFSRSYYAILIPLIVVLFIAIGMRIADYGITVNRYFLFMLGTWLSLICFYFIIGRKNIKVIPISLTALIIIISVGPWGAFAVSERSQVKRLENILSESGILKSGKIQNEQSVPDLISPDGSGWEPVNSSLVSDSLQREIRSIINYLNDHHRFNKIKGWFQQDIDSLISAKDTLYFDETNGLMGMMGLDYTERVDNSFSFSSKRETLTLIGYDYAVTFDDYGQSTGEQPTIIKFVLDSMPIKIQLDNEEWWLLTYEQNDTVLVRIMIEEIVESLMGKYSGAHHNDIPTEEMVIYSSNRFIDTKFQLKSVTGSLYGGKISIYGLEGTFYFTLK